LRRIASLTFVVIALVLVSSCSGKATKKAAPQNTWHTEASPKDKDRDRKNVASNRPRHEKHEHPHGPHPHPSSPHHHHPHPHPHLAGPNGHHHPY